MFTKRMQKGFTLIELMVVVAIIGILMASGILAFSNAQISARDAKRKADVDAISKALEQYNQANSGNYPVAAGMPAAIQPYFPSNSVPADPKGGAYTLSMGTGTSYCVCAVLEKTGAGNASIAPANGACSYGTGAANQYWCASQRQ